MQTTSGKPDYTTMFNVDESDEAPLVAMFTDGEKYAVPYVTVKDFKEMQGARGRGLGPGTWGPGPGARGPGPGPGARGLGPGARDLGPGARGPGP